jgi:nucleoside-diphosphate-sugar epimerase
MEPARRMRSLFCFGLGYSALALAERLSRKGWRISGTIRDEDRGRSIEARGYQTLLFNSADAVCAALASHDHILVSVPPDEAGDPVLNSYRHQLIARGDGIRWLGYLSTTGVYGDRGGAWVDETSTPEPTTARGKLRLAAEQGWRDLHASAGLPVHIFRLAGIYGPGRNQLLSVRAGTARRIGKPGQVFSRIHVEDLAGVLEASINQPKPGRVYNVCDDEPAPPQDVVSFAAGLLGLIPPAEIPLREAGLRGMSASFYEETKRVSNRRMKEELNYRLLYPTYREGLLALKSAL